MSKTQLEVKEYTFDGDIKITVSLDRREKKLSFVEWNETMKEYIPQTFQFSGREIQYMNGWVNILKAMEYVINDCKPIMESWDQEETEQLVNLLVAMDGAKSS